MSDMAVFLSTTMKFGLLEEWDKFSNTSIIIKFTCSYPAHQCHPKETQHMCPEEDENEARLLYHQISTSSPITPINFPLAELRAILPFQDLK